MTEVWNFRKYIARKLENYERTYISDEIYSGYSDVYTLTEGAFVDEMLKILSVKMNNPDDYRGFIEWCNEYGKVRGCDIPEKEAKEIFAEFERLVNL